MSSTNATNANLPGRLGDPAMTLATDPRTDPRLVAVMEPLGLAGEAPPVPVTAESSLEELRAYVDEIEPGFETMFDHLFATVPAIDGIDVSTERITGMDGNDLDIFIHRPANASGPMPCVLHTHGGGMALLSAAGASYQYWRNTLASFGMVVVGVEFRNAGGKLGPHPFPAGLTDCASALHWIDDHRSDLGVSSIVVSGESGGGNLALAVGLKANQAGHAHIIDGIYAQCPYISGTYYPAPPELTSLHENDGYFLSGAMMAPLARVYDPTWENANNPLAWPLQAQKSDLEGLPPHIISVNELDPLRDEGLAYYRKLLDAGVSVAARTVNGTCHAGDLLLPADMGDVYAASARDVAGFALAR